jgi:hypothetical protein
MTHMEKLEQNENEAQSYSSVQFDRRREEKLSKLSERRRNRRLGQDPYAPHIKGNSWGVEATLPDSARSTLSRPKR